MKKYWYCEGVDESWLTAEGDDDWEDLVKRYSARYGSHPAGPYYHASDVEEMTDRFLEDKNGRIAELEAELDTMNLAVGYFHEENDRFIARMIELEKALREIKEMTDADNPESYRSDDREGCLDTVFSKASRSLMET